MKKGKIRSSVLAGFAALFMAFAPVKDGGIKEITKPHLGIYECEQALLSGEDMTSEFDYVRLELKSDGTFLLYYRKTDCKECRETGKYVYDKEAGTICLSVEGAGVSKRTLKRTFPLKDGVLSVNLRVGKKTLQMQFKQK